LFIEFRGAAEVSFTAKRGKENPSWGSKTQGLSFRESSLFKGLRRPQAFCNAASRRGSTPPLSNLQDGWKEFKIRRKEIKATWNNIKVRRDRNPNPTERNPNLVSFHESSLFNGLSPILAVGVLVTIELTIEATMAV